MRASSRSIVSGWNQNLRARPLVEARTKAPLTSTMCVLGPGTGTIDVAAGGAHVYANRCGASRDRSLAEVKQDPERL